MLCDRCGEREATHHDVVVTGGQIKETHLCERCAAELGLGVQSGAVGAFLSQVLSPVQGVKPTESATQARCEHCGMTFAEFKNSGLMGCAGCYEAFEARLVPLLERAHEGGNRHIGKTPRRSLARGRTQGLGEASAIEDAHARADRIERLRRELGEAVQSEAYERAASIRDELRALTHPGDVTGGGGGD
jgi:protein arginine kinase activator